MTTLPCVSLGAYLGDIRVLILAKIIPLDSGDLGRSSTLVNQICGVDCSKKYYPAPATTKYTDFITSTASGIVVGERGPLNFETPHCKTEVSAFSVGTMVPCLNLNANLAMEMKKILDADSHNLYPTWDDNYSSETFEASVMQFEQLLDQLRASYTDYEFDVVQKVYLEALKLRVDFFPSLAIGQQSAVPFCKMHDPAKDRLPTVVSAPKTDQNEPQVLCADRKSRKEMKLMWESISPYVKQNIIDESSLCIERIVSSHQGKKINYQGLRKAVEQVASFQKQANSHMTEMMALKGINMEHLKCAVEKMQLQSGCMNFFQQVNERKVELNADIQIISYCWCGDIIRSVFSSGGLDSINVHSNELVYEDSLTTGEMMRKIESPIVKLQVFKDTLLKSEGSVKAISVYIGRNVGDLLSLLEADGGIVIGNNRRLRRLCDHVGVSRVSLFSGAVRKQKDLLLGRTLRCPI